MLDPEVTASLIKNRRTTLERIEKYISDKYFTDVNLHGRLFPKRRLIERIFHWKLPGRNISAWQLWKFEDIKKQRFMPVRVGQTFGPSWSTHWFKIEFRVPEEWQDKEVHFKWDSQSEATIWNDRGEVLQGISTGTTHQLRPDYILAKRYTRLGYVERFYIEMVCSRMFGLGKDGMINPPNLDENFTLVSADICTFDREIYNLIRDLEVLHGLAKNLEDDQRGFRALYTANQMINTIVSFRSKKERTGLRLAAQMAKDFFKQSNGEMALTLAMIGNCHIDSAWLWPYTESKRKCARSWSSTLKLMDDYPEMIFACSQAQQFAWVKHYYPQLFKRIKVKVQQKRFIPVGCTWVEMDGLLPSGESFMRQFLYGQLFFKREFGITCTEFWLPDTFGYSGQIPQICNHFNVKRFLTQKLSWNLVNKFPNHTFIWEGIDGSSVITHFPPGDSYEMNVEAGEALKSERNLRDKGRVNICGFLYGYGDGGGGPTEDMLERAQRLKDIDGCPKMQHMSPSVMFKKIEKDRRNLTRWVGELYLELHNGTYTAQAYTKLQNRRCEFHLMRAEMLLSMVVAYNLAETIEIKIQRHKCEEAWKSILLNQFHDVLPGSSIRKVYEDSDKLYEESISITNEVIDFAMRALSTDSPIPDYTSMSVINVLPWNVRQVVVRNSVYKENNEVSQPPNSNVYIAIHSPPLSFSKLNFDSVEGTVSGSLSSSLREATIIHPPSVRIRNMVNYFELENQYILTHINLYGHILRLIDKKNNSRDVFEKKDPNADKRDPDPKKHGRGNLISFYDDIPLYWDAWDVMDYHLETRKVVNIEKNKERILLLTLTEDNPLRCEFEWAVNINEKSLLRQKISLSALDPYLTFSNIVTWKESHKMLKVEFNTGLLAREASYDIQFGHISRPNHFNTSWDSAKYETCGHKWADISEHDCGLAVFNNCKYGWSCKGNIISLSLIRAPKAPDDTADMGQHKFNYALMPHRGTFQEAKVIEAALEFNAPISLQRGRPIDFIHGWIELIGRGVMIDATKVAEMSTTQVVVRLHEMYGSVRIVWLKINKKLGLLKAEDCNGMEDWNRDLPVEGIAPVEDPHPSINHLYIACKFWPFQIRTIKLSFHKFNRSEDTNIEELEEKLKNIKISFRKADGGPIETVPSATSESEESLTIVEETEQATALLEDFSIPSLTSEDIEDSKRIKNVSISSEDEQFVKLNVKDVHSD